jgi:hypothetical protein
LGRQAQQKIGHRTAGSNRIVVVEIELAAHRQPLQAIAANTPQIDAGFEVMPVAVDVAAK